MDPGSMLFYDSEGECVLSLYISVQSAPEVYSRASGATITGSNELVSLLSEVLLPIGHDASSNPLILDISDELMEFKEQKKLLFSLKIKSQKKYVGDGDCS
ncbi:MAG: hypothetical protein R2741_13405 [Methanolobus sp.]